jgi:hypothetical protein
MYNRHVLACDITGVFEASAEFQGGGEHCLTKVE